MDSDGMDVQEEVREHRGGASQFRRRDGITKDGFPNVARELRHDAPDSLCFGCFFHGSHFVIGAWFYLDAFIDFEISIRSQAELVPGQR
jgi:hypothetical protein